MARGLNDVLRFLGPDTPAAALARAVLSGDTTAIPALLDTALESFHADGCDVAMKAKELAERVRDKINTLYDTVDGEGNRGPRVPWAGNRTASLELLLGKLRDLGYGEAVDAYVRPATSIGTAQNWELSADGLIRSLGIPPELMGAADGANTNYASNRVELDSFAGRFDRSHEPT